MMLAWLNCLLNDMGVIMKLFDDKQDYEDFVQFLSDFIAYVLPIGAVLLLAIVLVHSV